MPTWTAFFNTIILLGVVQGFIVSGLLFFSKKNRQPTRFLGVLILLITLASFKLYGEYSNWFGSDLLGLISQILPLICVMPFGPLIYFYTRSSVDPGFKFRKKDWRHFYPVIIDLIPALAIITYLIGLSTGLLKKDPGSWVSFIDNYNVYSDIPRWLSITIYIGMSVRYLAACRKKNPESNPQGRINFKWLQQFHRTMIVFQSIWLVFLVPYVMPKYTDKLLETFEWYPLYIPMAILIYWLGIKGYLVSQQPVPIEKKAANPASALTGELVQRVIQSLTRAMEVEKLYLNPNLNLSLMAESTGFAQKLISAVLNQHLQKSFNEFVNQYRVNEFKEKILQSEMNHLTIAGIAFTCGFNSQATFQRTFKDITGKSPTEFRKQGITV